MYIFHWNKN